MSKLHIIWVHFLAFIVLAAILFFSSEFLLKAFLPNFHDVAIWIFLIVGGTILLFLLSLISLIIFLIIRKQRLKSKIS